MENLKYTIEINASKQKVWDTMLQPESYKKWTGVSWPGSYYEGRWEQGTDIKFLSTSGGGTLATIDELKPHETVKATHNAVILKDGTEDRNSAEATGWLGTKEWYTFSEKNGKTEVKVEMQTSSEWASMFDKGWPAALDKLKELAETA